MASTATEVRDLHHFVGGEWVPASGGAASGCFSSCACGSSGGNRTPEVRGAEAQAAR